MLLKFAIKDFIEDREFKNLSKVTIDGYHRTIQEFHDFCVQREVVDCSDITASTIKSYLLHCQKDRINNPTSINHKLHNLKIFTNYMEEIGIYNEKNNPAKKISYLKTDIKIEIFTNDQIKQMLGYYQRLKFRHQTFWAYRDYFLITTLLSTGIRLGEAINLKWDDIDIQNQSMTVFGKKRSLRSIPITSKLIKEICEYKVFVQQQFEHKNIEFVFTNRNNEQLTVNGVKCIFKRLKTNMNFKNVRLSAHTFRHTFCSSMIKSGCDLLSLQRMMGHANLSMLNKYYALWGTSLKSINDKHNPLNGIDL